MIARSEDQKAISGGGPADIKAIDPHFKSRLNFNQTSRDRIAIIITNTFGTIKFLCGCICFFFVWIIWNLDFLPFLAPFDPYPFPALEMVVSIFAIILSVSVLISQKRQASMENISQQIEFEVNVRAENEITKMLEMLHEIQKKMGIDNNDSELEKMKEDLNIKELHEKLAGNEEH